MSRKPSKFRKAKREQRSRKRPINLTHGIMVGDGHIGLGNHGRDQLLAYAYGTGLNPMVIHGGDLIHHHRIRDEINDAAKSDDIKA